MRSRVPLVLLAMLAAAGAEAQTPRIVAGTQAGVAGNEVTITVSLEAGEAEQILGIQHNLRWNVLTPVRPLSNGEPDCDGDGRVGVHELIVGVDVSLGRRPLADCRDLDRADDGAPGVDDLVDAVQSSIRGCAAASEAR